MKTSSCFCPLEKRRRRKENKTNIGMYGKKEKKIRRKRKEEE